MNNNPPFKISNKKKEAGIYCCAYGCSNDPVYKKGGLYHKHYRRFLRWKDPVQIRYNGMKWNAKKRGIEFTITLEQFRFFCKKTGYILNKGYRGFKASLDRRCNAQGYHIWNIQLMSARANARKGSDFNGDRISYASINNEDEELPF